MSVMPKKHNMFKGTYSTEVEMRFSKMKILSSFTHPHPHVIPNLDNFSYAEHKMSHFEESWQPNIFGFQ